LTRQGPLQDLLEKARKRCIWHLALDSLLLAAAIGLGAAALVLVAGTEYLGFYWIAVSFAVGICAGAYFLRKRTPATYAVARQMDERLKLSDTLSTAAYFSDSAAPVPSNPEIREAQWKRAEQLAPGVDLKAALPLARPRMLYPAVAMALAALGVFLFRFAVTGSFDPRASLVKNALQSMLNSSAEKAKVQTKAGESDKQGDGQAEEQDIAKNNDYAGDPASEPNPTASEEQAQNKSDSRDGDQPQEGEGQPQDAQSPQGEPQLAQDDQNQGDSQNNNAGKQNQDSSLLDKVKQAISDMLNKMKPQSGDGNGKQSQKSESAQSKQQKSDSQDDSQGDEQENANENQNGADSQEEANNSSNQSNKEQQSGAGNNEGDKAQRQAEALKAMGKLSELLGKRAENVTGAVMVEVGSTKQQMKTPIAQRSASHSEAGSEIHRDEVPPLYEQYVQQYFEQVRKTASKPAAQPKQNK
jgi:hypothetical protein